MTPRSGHRDCDAASLAAFPLSFWHKKVLAALRQTTTADYEAQTDIRHGAARGWVDAIIPPEQTRSVLIQAIEAAVRPVPKGGFRGGVLQV